MSTEIAAVVLFAVVAVGILLQVATLARVGGRIARLRLARRIAKWRAHQPKLTQPVVRPAMGVRLPGRRRCREYRTALRTART